MVRMCRTFAAIVQIASHNSQSACFDPSAVRVNNETTRLVVRSTSLRHQSVGRDQYCESPSSSNSVPGNRHRVTHDATELTSRFTETVSPVPIPKELNH